MVKGIYQHIGFLAFLLIVFFNSSSLFTEAKAVVSVESEAKLDDGPSITVYNQNRALIKEKHHFVLDKGFNHLDWDNLAATIDIRSVNLSSVNIDKPIEVKEQSYQSDLISASTILNRSVGKSVVLRHYFSNGVSDEQGGVLLGGQSPSERVIKMGDRYLLNPEGQMEVSEMPSGLVAQPKLSFVVKALETGKKIFF